MTQATILDALVASLPPVAYDAAAQQIQRQALVTAQPLAASELLIDEIFLEEDPANADVTLSDWERVLGLPDCCTTTAQTVPERVSAVVEKWLSRGGLSRAYFIDMMARRGVTITIDELGNFTWRINRDLLNYKVFSAGSSVAGDPLRDWGDDTMECRINRLKPAHTLAVYGYWDWAQLRTQPEPLSSAVTFTRPDAVTCVTRTSATGVLQAIAANLPVIDYEPQTLSFQGLRLRAPYQQFAKNNTMVGAGVGVRPTGWPTFGASGLASGGISIVGPVVEDGIEALDVDFAGVSNANGTFSIFFTTTGAAGMAVTAGVANNGSFYGRLVSGSYTGIGGFRLAQHYYDASSAVVGSDDVSPDLKAAVIGGNLRSQRVSRTHIPPAGAVASRMGLSLTYPSGQTMAMRLRLGLPCGVLGNRALPPLRTAVAATATSGRPKAEISNLSAINWNPSGWSCYLQWLNDLLGLVGVNGVAFCLCDGTTANMLQVYVNSAGQCRLQVVSGGGAPYDALAAATNPSTLCKGGLTLYPDRALISVNGAATTTHLVNIPMSSFTKAYLCSDPLQSDSSFLDGWLQAADGHYMPRSAAQLQALSA